jgi:hypothetical protein
MVMKPSVKFSSDVQVSTIPMTVDLMPVSKDLKLKAPIPLKTNLGTLMVPVPSTESIVTSVLDMGVSCKVPDCEGILHSLSQLSHLSGLIELFTTTFVPAVPAPIITPISSSLSLSDDPGMTVIGGWGPRIVLTSEHSWQIPSHGLSR